jgi:hypothetical protein
MMMLDIKKFSKTRKNKALRGIYLVDYLNEVKIAHLMTNFDSNEDFKEIQQWVISVVELKKGKTS